jgi:hypothetical protein
MTYIRKTKDVYQLITNYGHGEEVEVEYDTLKEAREDKKAYIQNCKELISIKIKKVREKL